MAEGITEICTYLEFSSLDSEKLKQNLSLVT